MAFIILKSKDTLLMFAFGGCFIVSCVNKNESSGREKVAIKTSSTEQQTSTNTNIPVADTTSIKKENKSVFPKGTWKNYPQIVRSVFGEGSTKEEVLNIMGRPEMIERPEVGVEIWYYGRVEVQIKNTIVRYVVNSNECNKYVFYEDLLVSPDPIEKRFGIKLLYALARH